jgi:hypothetical protein
MSRRKIPEGQEELLPKPKAVDLSFVFHIVCSEIPISELSKHVPNIRKMPDGFYESVIYGTLYPTTDYGFLKKHPFSYFSKTERNGGHVWGPGFGEQLIVRWKPMESHPELPLKYPHSLTNRSDPGFFHIMQKGKSEQLGTHDWFLPHVVYSQKPGKLYLDTIYQRNGRWKEYFDAMGLKEVEEQILDMAEVSTEKLAACGRLAEKTALYIDKIVVSVHESEHKSSRRKGYVSSD